MPQLVCLGVCIALFSELTLTDLGTRSLDLPKSKMDGLDRLKLYTVGPDDVLGNCEPMSHPACIEAKTICYKLMLSSNSFVLTWTSNSIFQWAPLHHCNHWTKYQGRVFACCELCLKEVQTVPTLMESLTKTPSVISYLTRGTTRELTPQSPTTINAPVSSAIPTLAP